MRRKDREITDFSKILSYLAECDCCRIGLVDDGEAYIVPMNFGFETEGEQLYLYFHCAKEGRKLDLLPKQQTVSFEADAKHALTVGNVGCDCTFAYRCIMGKGNMEQLEQTEQKIHGLQAIMLHHTGRADWTFRPETLAATAVLKLTVTDWSCKEHL